MPDARGLPSLLGGALEGVSVRLAVLFGSAARGEMHPRSDVDLAIVASGDMSLAEELALEVRLSAACGREVQLVHLDRANDLLRWEIARDGVLVKGDRADFLRFVVAAARVHADEAPLWRAAGETFRKRLAAGGR